MHFFKKDNGTTLVELMVALVIFSIVIGTIYSVNIAFMKYATSERKGAKTEMDIVNASWPLIKEIGSAGFGAPRSGICTPALEFTDGVLTVRSTAAGDSQNAGKWSFVGSSCAVTGIPDGAQVIVINNLNRSRVGASSVSGGVIQGCVLGYKGHIAYWIPSAAGECYETKYRLDAPSTAMTTCAPGSLVLQRSSVIKTTSAADSYGAMLSCVRAFGARFGCISSAGDLTWQADDNCGTSRLRLVKIGLIVQNSMRREEQIAESLDLFEDLGPAMKETITLTNDQRYYKWRKIEQTITLKNPE